MHALLALAAATSLDLWRRASTGLIALVAVFFILSLRYFSTFGLGYEVIQLQELGVYTLGLFGALAVLLFCMPRDDDEAETADNLLLVRPVSVHTLALGAYLGRLFVVTALVAIWALAIVIAISWLAWADPQMFTYRGETSVYEHATALAAPVFGQWLTLAVLLAFAQPLARLRRPILISSAYFLIYAAGFAAPALGRPLALILPDLARYDLTPMLWGTEMGTSLLWLALHGACWSAAGLAIDALQLRLKSA